ncbi:MAG TPA: CAP domain-containing protein [Verrucomicrobiota bacterium]|nr:CAP domain-containing protein [Verrucomicrobiota bacterium]HNU49343.1 CAP domain-containing protein [Verrucomicrobiota bacterium]
MRGDAVGSARRWAGAWLGGLLLSGQAAGFLGEAPDAFAAAAVAAPPRVALASADPGFVVQPASREASRNFFNAVYGAGSDAESGWNGSVAGCQPGTTSPEFREAVRRRVNFYRAMAGVPAAIAFDADYELRTQRAALMMSANGTLEHYPPSNWSCYDDGGAEAARNSNLALGSYGVSAIDGYVEDYGDDNAAVGHRRWLFYPQTRAMGTGDVPGRGGYMPANVLWIFDGRYGTARPATREPFVAWPPPGFVPYPIVYPRWSFTYPAADFSAASVSMWSNAVAVAVSIESQTQHFGENTLVWHLDGMSTEGFEPWPKPAQDTAFHVEVRGVVVDGISREFSYDVTVFDPQVTASDTVWPVVSGPPQAAVLQHNTYSVAPVPTATGYQWRQSRATTWSRTEGAETGLSAWQSRTSPGYDVLVDHPRVSGSRAFHLAHVEPVEQSLTLTLPLLPGPQSQLEFQSRLGYATSGQIAQVEVAPDGLGAWTVVWAQAGTEDPENTFYRRTVSLSPFAGRSIRVRFSYHYAWGAYYPQADAGVGWHLDDIRFTGVEELVESQTGTMTGTAFILSPPQAGTYALEARALVQGGFPVEWGPATRVTALILPVPKVRWVAKPSLRDGAIGLEFEVENHRAGLVLQLWQAPAISGTWEQDAAATLETVQAGLRFRFVTGRGNPDRGFYKVRID